MLRSGRAVASYLATPRLRTLPLKINPVHTGFTFAVHFLMCSRCAGFVLKDNFAFTFTRIPATSWWRNRHTFARHTADVQLHFHTGVYSRLRHELCAMGYTTFSPVFCQFHGAFSPQFAGACCHVFIAIFRDSKADFPRHGNATFEKWGSSN